jgi:hypothetical protein
VRGWCGGRPGAGRHPPAGNVGFCYPLTLIRGADQAAGVEGNNYLRRGARWSPDRMSTRLGGYPHQRCCRTGRVEAWCIWSSCSWLPPRHSFVCGYSSAGNKLRWTLSRGFPPRSKLWLRPHGRRAGSGCATQAAVSGCRGRGAVLCWGGSLPIDPMRGRAHYQRGADALHEQQRAVEPMHEQQRAVEPMPRPQRAVEPMPRPQRAGRWHETARSDVPTQGPLHARPTTPQRGRSPSRPATHPALPAPSATRVSSARPRL